MARRRSKSKSVSAAPRSRPARASGGSMTPWIVLAVVVIAGAALTSKGWMVDAQEKLANTSADGVVTQLLAGTDGHKFVQASAVLDLPADKVWSVVTDYAHYSEIFPGMNGATVERTKDGRRRLSGEINLAPMPIKWKFSMKINHEKKDKVNLAEWDETNEAGKTSRGFWRVEDLGDGHTRVVHRIDSNVAPLPGFLVRSAVRSKLPSVFAAISTRIGTPSTPATPVAK